MLLLPPQENTNSGLDSKLLNNNNPGSSQSNELLFIDSAIENYQTLIDNLVEQTEVIILDSRHDGIVQIINSLEQYDSLDAVHIVSHGDVGELSLGNTKLNQANLENYTDDLLNWGNSLTENADILLYGCNAAKDLAGAEFVNDFSDYTKADVAASIDLTGSKNLGGNWNLEYALGNIEADLAFDTQVDRDYEYVLDSLIINNPPIFDNGTYFRNFPADVTLPDSDGKPTLRSEPGTIQLDRFILSEPVVDSDPPDLLNPGMIDLIDNSDFRIEYFPTDLSFIDSPTNPGTSIVNFGEAENQPFSLYFGNGNFFFKPSKSYKYDHPGINSLIFPFDASSLNFNPTNFEFTSVFINRVGPIDPDNNSITFQFDKGSFDFSSLTDRNVLQFEFESETYDFYDIQPDNTVSFGNNLSFEATGVSFRSDSVTFDYKPRNLNFNPTPFVNNANAHLFEYKLSAADFEAGVTVEQFNASDYRALNYAFKNDELFDHNYYLGTYVVPNETNPFTSYTENGYKLGANPNGLFDVNYYLSNNADVRNLGTEPLKHFATKGYTQDNLNRDPNALFDTSYYKAQNSDVVDEDANPLLHYIQFGYKEDFDSRDPNPLFDTSYYNAKNPKVIEKGSNPLQHYLEFGWQESRIDNPGGFNANRDPHPFFDTSHYFDTHSDVRIASYELASANALQHYLEFGNSGRFANEDRVTHPLFETEYLTAFSTSVNSNSEGFGFVQGEINTSDSKIQVFPRDDGRVLVAQASDIPGEDPITEILEDITYTVYAIGAFLVLQAGKFVYEIAEGSNTFTNYSFSLGDASLDSNIFVSPGDSEGSISAYVFPKNPNVESILDLTGNENIFYTPLEPTEEISSPNVFPQRDEILEGLLEEPFIFPDVSVIPQGAYIIDNSTGNPYPVGISSSQGIQEVEDFVSGLGTEPTPTSTDSGRYEIEQAGLRNYTVPTGRISPNGTPETVDIDGFRGRTLLEVKYLRDPTSSPRIAGTSAPSFLREKFLRDDRYELERYQAVIKDPSTPFTELEVIVSDDRLVPYFEGILNELDIPAQVIVKPSQAQ